jgi:hypothetical protein
MKPNAIALPVAFRLRVNGRISVDFAGGRLKNFAIETFCQTEHIDGAMNRGLRRLHGIMLIMDGGRWTGEVIDFVHLHVERESYIVPHELEMRMIVQVFDVAFCTCEEIVETDNLVSLLK